MPSILIIFTIWIILINLIFHQDGPAGLGMYLTIGGPGVGGGVEEYIGELLALFR
jgi:hypothetical protein